MASATASTVAMAVHDTNSAMELSRNTHHAEGAVHERLGVWSMILAWLVRRLLLARSKVDRVLSLMT